MSAKTWILAATFAAAAAALIFAWRASAATRIAKRGTESIAVQGATIRAKLQRLEAVRAEAEAARAETQATLASVRSKQPTPGLEPTSASPIASKLPPAPALNPNAVLADDPKLQALSVAAQRARFETVYGPLLHALRLSRPQVATLGAAHAKFDALQQDIAMVMHAQRLPPNDPAVSKLRQQAEEELRAAQLEVLGAAGYEQLRNYERSLPARGIVERFAGALAVADRPMTAAQADRLTQILAEASGTARAGARVNLAAIDWGAVDQRAAEVLSPNQLSLFKRIEPIGGGASRWMAQFDRAVQAAMRTMAASPPPRPESPKL